MASVRELAYEAPSQYPGGFQRRKGVGKKVRELGFPRERKETVAIGALHAKKVPKGSEKRE